MTAIAASVRNLAETIDLQPGVLESDLMDTLEGAVFGVGHALRALGYRSFEDGYDKAGRVSRWRWWPSRSRCAELARTATGERRETLLRGMWL